MIDPVIFEFNLLGLPIILRWYGVLVMLGAVSGGLIAEREIKRRGENGESVWDALVWILPAGIIGARLWYVLNSILGGSNYYTVNRSRSFIFGKVACISLADYCWAPSRFTIT